MRAKEHWEHVYTTKSPNAISWFQEHAERSLRLILSTGIAASAPIIDVGGGTSTLVDDLLASGHSALTVLDISAAALAATQKRLGPRAKHVRWMEADVTAVTLPMYAFDVWQDRAVFQFLTSPEQLAAYMRAGLRVPGARSNP